MKNIILYGAGGHCHAVIELINSLNEFQPLIIYDDNPEANEILDIEITSNKSTLSQTEALCITIGNNKIRKEIANSFKEKEFPSFVHSTAHIYPSCSYGNGTQILPLSLLDAEVQMGNFCIINNHATLSHNVILEDFVHVAIQETIAGGVYIGEGTLIGAGSIILPEIKIGKWVTIGAGSVVTKDVPDGATVIGNPARIIKSKPDF